MFGSRVDVAMFSVRPVMRVSVCHKARVEIGISLRHVLFCVGWRRDQPGAGPLVVIAGNDDWPAPELECDVRARYRPAVDADLG